jgi:2,4-dienoyl-CoA reductase (NADPH2)
MKLLEPLDVGHSTAKNRVLFGPHATNLGRGRTISPRHVAYYEERARGGAGIVVIEEASVHRSDWPYERCPSAAEAGAGWAATVEACAGSGALVLAALGHTGGQGTSAYSQRELWAPSDEPEVDTREVPKIMELEDIAQVVDGFRRSAAVAVEAGLDGIEVNAGQRSLVRQFLSGLTNRRSDRYGEDRLLFAREVLTAARAGLGPTPLLGLRLSCDELAPWAGVTPELAGPIAVELSELVDYVVVVRGAIFTVAETRPTGHHGTGINVDLAAGIRQAIDHQIPVFAQGSIVDPDAAERAVADGSCDGVEMTRAQIADPVLVRKLEAGAAPRPCVLCNQLCRVRDNRNPIVGCILDPRAGHETTDPKPPEPRSPVPERPTTAPKRKDGRAAVLVVGAGPAGLEAARVAACGGCDVTVVEAAERVGGLLPSIGRAPGHQRFELLADHLAGEAEAAGAAIQLGVRADRGLLDDWEGPIVLAVGGRNAVPDHPIEPAARVLDPLSIIDADHDHLDELVPASVAIWDPVGNNVAVAVAELLAAGGRSVTFITPDAIAGTLLSRSGDLAGANVRLQQAGVTLARRERLVAVGAGSATVSNVFTAVVRNIDAPALIDCSPRLPDDSLWAQIAGTATERRARRVGDALATRTVGEAIREGREAAMELLAATGARNASSGAERSVVGQP